MPKKSDLAPFERIISNHHILTLATCVNETPYCATLFYAYDADTASFIVASDKNTEHIAQVMQNGTVAGAIALETKSVGKIEGIQFQATMRQTDESRHYFQAYPYAKAMNPTLWRIELTWMKLTDNRLGFGKKLTWRRGVSP